jgi:hypothetical protein
MDVGAWWQRKYFVPDERAYGKNLSDMPVTLDVRGILDHQSSI